jgi:hypothetical protein
LTFLIDVLAVTDAFLRPIRRNAKHLNGRKKMWRNKTPQRAQARLVFCLARAAEGGEAFTVLLCAVKSAIKHIQQQYLFFTTDKINFRKIF